MSIPSKAPALCSAANNDNSDDDGSIFEEIFVTSEHADNDEDDSFTDLYAVIEGRARAKPSTSSLHDSKGRKDPEAQPRRNNRNSTRRQVTRSHSPSGPMRRGEDSRSASPKLSSKWPESAHTHSDGPMKSTSSSGTRGTKATNGSNSVSLNGSISSRSSAASSIPSGTRGTKSINGSNSGNSANSSIPSPRTVRSTNDGDSNELKVLLRNVSINSLPRRHDSSVDRICRSTRGNAQSSSESGRANSSAHPMSSRTRQDASPHPYGVADVSLDHLTLHGHDSSMDSPRQRKGSNSDPHIYGIAFQGHHPVRMEQLHRSAADHNNRTDHDRLERLSDQPSDRERRRGALVRSMSPTAGSPSTRMLLKREASSKSLSPGTTTSTFTVRSRQRIMSCDNMSTTRMEKSPQRKMSVDNMSSTSTVKPPQRKISLENMSSRSKQKYMNNLFK
jgi:hypothetical protein